jgi:hypothetical protein
MIPNRELLEYYTQVAKLNNPEANFTISILVLSMDRYKREENSIYPASIFFASRSLRDIHKVQHKPMMFILYI